MVASQWMPIEPMAYAGYAPRPTPNGPGWVPVFELPAGSIVIESGWRLRVDRNGPNDQWMVTGRGQRDGVALVMLDDQWNTFRTVDIATLLALNPSLLEGLDVGTATVASSDDLTVIRLTTHEGADQEIPVVDFVNAHIEDLRRRLVLLVDVG